MNISFNWLKTFVDLSGISVKEFCDKMTMSGSKVEMYENEKDRYKNIVTGKILSIEKHKNADSLVVCQVDINDDAPIQIVTGATNIKVGDIVPCALDGSFLPNGTNIKRSELRGVVSNGMMCSLEELEFYEDDFKNVVEDGILILDNDIKIGQNISDVCDLNDSFIEFEITPNRTDCLSIFGLAVEASATFNRKLNIKNQIEPKGTGSILGTLNVDIKTEKCNRYISKLIKNVKVKPSPSFIQKRLKACGLRPINNIVDITNYVMLEYGQPMHCFDLDKITSTDVNISFCENGEHFKALNGNDYILTDKNLAVKSGDKAIAVAGVIGGESTQVDNNTINVLFEAANFDGSTVRASSKSLNLRTDSSTKFEKGINPNLCDKAIIRACELIKQLNCGDIINGTIDIYNNEPNKITINLNDEKINNFLGTNIPKDDMVNILKSLRFSVTNNRVTPPYFRDDVCDIYDLAEEIARIYGYDNIPTTLPKSNIIAETKKEETFIYKLKNILTSNGLNEVLTYSFISPNDYEKINIDKENAINSSVKIKNPLGENTSIMRFSALPSMMSVLSLNYNNRNLDVSLFEIVKEYEKTNDKLPLEKNKLIIGAYGNNVDFYSIKSVLNSILNKFMVNDVQFVQCIDNPSYHSGRCANVVINDNILAVIGEVSPLVLENYNIKTRCYTLELDVDMLFKVQNELTNYIPLPKFPSVTRDIGLLCHKDTLVGDIKGIITKNGNNIIESVKMFDIFEDNSIGEDNKVVAFNITMRSKVGTLKDSDVDFTINNILDELKNINVTLRL